MESPLLTNMSQALGLFENLSKPVFFTYTNPKYEISSTAGASYVVFVGKQEQWK